MRRNLKEVGRQILFSRYTKELRNDWEVAANIIPDDLRLEVEKIAGKWGLRCDWGCGFIINFSLDFDRGFILSSGPPDSTIEVTFKIDIYDDNDTIKQQFKDQYNRVITFLENTRDNLSDMDYRGFERQAKKEIAAQIQWLFWHITPPYLNADQIANELENTVDQYYIKRYYQNMAKLLGINLKGGWPKGRRRAKQHTRAGYFENEMEAKIGLKNGR
ncbi:hypothetical protein ACFLXC_05805 [Chloroflexota bacterium]